jgi:hypothetical protein
VLGVAAHGRLDHLARTVDRGQVPAVEPLAHKRRRDAVAAADLQHPVGGLDPEDLDGPRESLHRHGRTLWHGAGRRAGRPWAILAR